MSEGFPELILKDQQTLTGTGKSKKFTQENFTMSEQITVSTNLPISSIPQLS